MTHPPTSTPISMAQRAERGAINLYRSLHRGGLSPCRFTPSCSQYALEALEIHGFFKGNVLILKRLLRCRPYGGSGFDPVPEHTRSHLGGVRV